MSRFDEINGYFSAKTEVYIIITFCTVSLHYLHLHQYFVGDPCNWPTIHYNEHTGYNGNALCSH